MAFFAYLLKCADGHYYAGHTDDLERRIAEHQSGALRGYTFERRPVELVWSDAFQTRDEALEVERKIKGWSRTKKEALIRGDWTAIQRLASRAGSGPFETGLRNSSVPPQGERGGEFSEKTAVCAEEGPKPQAEGPSRSNPPLIILVRPQLGENIGKAARAMLNFGLTELRLVAPRDGWPNPSAGPAASGADLVLERAQVFETLAEATADCAHVYATTVRKRGLIKPVVTPEAAATEIVRGSGRSAILFGPERSGLETDDVAVARTIVTVPINPEFGSLNLAQAVILVAYEWSKHQTLESPPLVDLDPPAPQEELDGLIGAVEAALEDRHYFFPEDRAPTTRRTLRSVLTKPAWNAQEVRTLRGIFRTLIEPKREG